MMERIAADGVRVIIVETANRFARDLIVQETGFEGFRDISQGAAPAIDRVAMRSGLAIQQRT